MAKILVVEDERYILEEVVDWLTFEGYDTRGEPNGRLGLKAIHEEMPDLILSDIAMPEMDGYELLYEVRSNPQFAHIPFIFLTASAERTDVRRGMNTGADDYITKPFSHGDVLNAVQSRIQKQAIVNRRVDELHSQIHAERENQMLKSRLTAMFSHDFRNPLASILSSSNIIRNYEAKLTPERKRQHLDRIDGGVHLLLQMLDDMLLVSQMESGHLDYVPAPMDLVRFVASVIDEFSIIDQSAHHLIFHHDLDHLVNADSKLIRQIISNLISNAIKYSPPASDIIISLEAVDGKIMFSVKDSGVGIPSESIPHLFSWFYRADNVKNIKGTGVGLCIVKECVQLHGGEISIDSQLNIGTTFTVTIPE